MNIDRVHRKVSQSSFVINLKVAQFSVKFGKLASIATEIIA